MPMILLDFACIALPLHGYPEGCTARKQCSTNWGEKTQKDLMLVMLTAGLAPILYGLLSGPILHSIMHNEWCGLMSAMGLLKRSALITSAACCVCSQLSLLDFFPMSRTNEATRSKGNATRSKDATRGAPGHTARNKKLLVTKGIATRSKDATSSS